MHSPSASVRLALFALYVAFSSVSSSDVSIDVASGAASQFVREALHQLLSVPRAAHISIQTHDEPFLSSLAKIQTENRISYSNISLKFNPGTVHVKTDNLRIRSLSKITPNMWPMSFSDENIHVDVQMGGMEVAARVEEQSAQIISCAVHGTKVQASSQNYWLLDTLLSLASIPIQNSLQEILCPFFSDYVSSVEKDAIRNISLWQVIPTQYRQLMNASESRLYYRLRAIQLQERHAKVIAQLEWNREAMESKQRLNSSSEMDIIWDNDDRVVLLIDDSAINEMIEQIEWDFQWMEQTIPVASPVIPLSSREFLSTLCTSCYFLLNVWARGPPSVHAVNGSIVLEKRDRINMRVVNPDRNVTSVFVSMVLSVNAELRPVVDEGTVRTLVQLLDTNVVMEKGAFPPTWAFFVQDLIRGMILDMMWPEMKKQIEELTYSEGVRLAASCGVDPRSIQILIEEGRLGVTASLILPKLKPQQCVADLKNGLPNAAKLFPKL